MPAMDDNTGLLFDLPSMARKKVSAAFDGGRITSDGGVASSLFHADHDERCFLPIHITTPRQAAPLR